MFSKLKELEELSKLGKSLSVKANKTNAVDAVDELITLDELGELTQSNILENLKKLGELGKSGEPSKQNDLNKLNQSNQLSKLNKRTPLSKSTKQTKRSKSLTVKTNKSNAVSTMDAVGEVNEFSSPHAVGGVSEEEKEVLTKKINRENLLEKIIQQRERTNQTDLRRGKRKNSLLARPLAASIDGELVLIETTSVDAQGKTKKKYLHYYNADQNTTEIFSFDNAPSYQKKLMEIIESNSLIIAKPYVEKPVGKKFFSQQLNYILQTDVTSTGGNSSYLSYKVRTDFLGRSERRLAVVMLLQDSFDPSNLPHLDRILFYPNETSLLLIYQWTKKQNNELLLVEKPVFVNLKKIWSNDHLVVSRNKDFQLDKNQREKIMAREIKNEWGISEETIYFYSGVKKLVEKTEAP